MANIREIKKVKELFEQKTKELNLKKEKSFQISSNQMLLLENLSQVQINIQKSCALVLNYSENFCGKISINISKNIDVSLFEILDSEKIFREIKIKLEKDAKLKHGFSNSKSRYAHAVTELKENSCYNLKGAYIADGIENFIRFETYHKGKNSQSNMEISGAAKNGAKIICDALVNISQKASRSSGHQKLFGLLLDETSQILSEPILEIETNDVMCSHAASVSQIRDEVQFYMKSRGLTKEQVVDIFVSGFFEEVKMHALKEKETENI